MKLSLRPLLSSAFCLGLALVSAAQPALPAGGFGGPPKGPRLGGAMSRIFGDHKAFTAQIEMRTKNPDSGEPMTIPGRFSLLVGKTRFDLDVTEIKGAKIPPQSAAQIKAFGLGEMAMISRPDKKLAYMIYPGMQAYLDNPLSEEEMAAPESAYKMDVTELGNETVDGHPCAKNKVTISDEKQNKHEATVWNANDLKKFPVRIDTSEDGQDASMLFKDVKFARPDAALFDAPANFTRYTSMSEMMRGMMLKQLGGALRKDKE